MNLVAPPLALYVHLPWCVRKCPYCDFNSHALEGRVPEQRYVSALLRDLDLQLERTPPRELISVFLGGGTPSLFSPAALDRLLSGVRARLPLNAGAEITMEANPGTIEHGRFAEYRSAGITRVSLGGQSFDGRQLAALGRIHTADEIYRAVEELRRAGIDNYNVDLMYGLPDQSVAQALADVEAAIGLEPAHLSHYQLTIEPGTVFFHRPPPLPDGDLCWEMQLRCQERLAAAGFAQYEVSGYARPGRRCVHNLNYWQFGDYLGIGAGAHGKITDAQHGIIERTSVVRQPRQYLESFARDPLARESAFFVAEPVGRQLVDAADLPFEFMLNTLRLLEGFTRAQFETRTGLDLRAIESVLDTARARGLIESPVREAWRPTALGLRFLNDLQASFLGTEPTTKPAQAPNLH